METPFKPHNKLRIASKGFVNIEASLRISHVPNPEYRLTYEIEVIFSGEGGEVMVCFETLLDASNIGGEIRMPVRHLFFATGNCLHGDSISGVLEHVIMEKATLTILIEEDGRTLLSLTDPSLKLLFEEHFENKELRTFLLQHGAVPA